ncbi:MAG: DNA methyltransferase [Candidatus Aenigmatarchaeota archaeon]
MITNFKIGVNKIYLDCRKPLPFEDNSIDLVITDPPWPFNLRISKNSKSVKATDFQIMTWEELKMFFKELYRVLKERCHSYIFCPPILLTEALGIIKDSGLNICQFLFWDKLRMGLGHLYRNQVEVIILLSKGFRKKIKSKNIRNIFYIKSTKGSVKPVELYELFVDQSSNPGDVVLDPFSGSGPLAKVSFKDRILILGDITYNLNES